jgi:hypothetical protein
MTEAEQVMKRCQIGTRNHEEANNLHADCYRVIGKLLAERSMREVQRLGQEIEQEQLISDQINYGMSITQGGKRIDPMSIYKEPEQEPVADDIASILACRNMLDAQPVPPRTWVGLTDEQANEYNYLGPDMYWVAQEIAAILKEQNT